MESEIRVYAIPVELGGRNGWDTSDEEFIEIAEDRGLVWSLSGFEDFLNDDESGFTAQHWVRIRPYIT